LSVAISLVPCFAADNGYHFTTVDFPGSVSTQVAGINNRGLISGAYVESGGVNRAFYDDGGVLKTVPGTGNISSETGRSSSRGVFVGDYVDPINFIDHSFVFSNGNLVTLPDVPNATVTSAIDLTDSGSQILAVYTTDPAQSKGFRGAIFSGGAWGVTFAYPGANVVSTFALGLNNAGYIVGSFQTTTPGEEHGFIRRPDGAFSQLDVTGAVQTEAFAINNSGRIVGRYMDSTGKNHGFLLADGKVTTIDVPGATFTYVFGINESGDIVGWYQTTPGPNVHGFIGRKN
jgi:probable HAF family extracellular repeat protein